MQATISVRDLRKSYGSLAAVDGVTFEVGQGEFFAILGPNGAGKTTTLEILEGLRKADSGEITVLGQHPWPRNPKLLPRIGVQLQEISDFVSVLDTAIPAHDMDVISLTVNVVDNDLRELIDQFPDHRDSAIAGGQAERRSARAALKDMVLNLSRIERAASAGNFDAAAAELYNYRYVTAAAAGAALRAAEPWSLFDAKSHDAHYDAMRQMQTLQTASKPAR